MTDAQEALNKEYPNKSSAKTIYLNNLNFQQSSELIIADYPNLKRITNNYQEIPHLTQLTITNCPQLETININSSKNIQQLILHNCPKLNHLDCPDNNLTSLDLRAGANLERINCPNNQLSQIKLPKGEKLKVLYLGNNNLNQDLSFLKNCVNLKILDLGNNPLAGSLEFLKGMSKLEGLWIDDTDLDSGLEYLPESVKYFDCSAKKRKDAKCKKLYRELHPKPIFGSEKTITLQEWKKANLPKLNQKTLQDQLKLLEAEKERLIKRISDLETLTIENKRLIKEQKQKIADNHYHFFTEEEKNALQELIKVHRAYEEAKKLKEESNKLYKQLFTLRQKLEAKLGEEFIEAVQSVLTDLEELYQREWDLQNQLAEKENLPTEIKNIEKNIADINKNIKALEANPNQTINNYITTGDIEVIGGHAMIGNTIGNQANLSHNKYATTIEEVEETEILEAKVQQAKTYGIPSSSKPK